MRLHQLISIAEDGRICNIAAASSSSEKFPDLLIPTKKRTYSPQNLGLYLMCNFATPPRVN
jgi:hypothetical protein